jgi:hypothetical protein
VKTIDYALLGRALALWGRQGFQQVEAPWRVGLSVIALTKPPHVDRADYLLAGTGKALVASGEQSLLYQACKGFLPPGRYMTVTPCFRNDDHGPYHAKQFLKLEVMVLGAADWAPTQRDVVVLANTAADIAAQLAPEAIGHLGTSPVGGDDPLAVAGTSQLDLVLEIAGREIELGSYGARRAPFAAWLYGTGLAEPRFSGATAELAAHVKHQHRTDTT